MNHGHTKKTQKEMIIEYMRKFGSISPMEALGRMGCMRLASRISELKKDGYLIESESETALNRFYDPVRYTRYYLKGERDVSRTSKS